MTIAQVRYLTEELRGVHFVLRAIAVVHTATRRNNGRMACLECGQDWPCRTTTLIQIAPPDDDR